MSDEPPNYSDEWLARRLADDPKPPDPETWRHADGSVRVDHMDARPGDYYGGAEQSEAPEPPNKYGFVETDWDRGYAAGVAGSKATWVQTGHGEGYRAGEQAGYERGVREERARVQSVADMMRADRHADVTSRVLHIWADWVDGSKGFDRFDRLEATDAK